MMVTIHLSDGRKITKDSSKLAIITNAELCSAMGNDLTRDGCISINWMHVVDIRPATNDEMECARIHRW